MDHPEDEAFLCWSESTGQLAYDDGATKNISLMSSPKTYANFIKGKVVDSNGKPVSAARVDCLFTRETPSFFQTRITLATDRDGYYSMYMPNSFTKA
ncbi:MAG: hypothetical protein Q4F54_04695 [Coriobacteriia bacterium]|nr:hypothetical protein [Coriobacteriia bacterium]